MRIFVIGTVHENTGRASTTELLAILLRVRPEVIFLEMPSSALADYSNGIRANLESIAVNRYRDAHDVDLVPVDLPTPEVEFFQNVEELSRRIRCVSPDYCRLVSWDSQYVEAHGFAYLNGKHFSVLLSQIHEARLEALAAMAEPELSTIYELWTSTNLRRDEAMLRNIESYCLRSSLSTGAFLVGAAHRESLAAESVKYTGAAASPIEWAFDGFL